MICKPLSNMQMDVFVWEVWEGKRQEGGEWRGVWKERREFSAIGQTTVLLMRYTHRQAHTHCKKFQMSSVMVVWPLACKSAFMPNQ